MRISEPSAHSVMVTKDGHLMVCLHSLKCEGTVSLTDLIRSDVKMCLYYMDREGVVKPLRPDVIKGDKS